MLKQIQEGLKAAKEFCQELDNLNACTQETIASIKKNGVILDELKNSQFRSLSKKS